MSIRNHTFGANHEIHRITVPYNSRFTLIIGGEVVLHEDVNFARFGVLGGLNRNATWRGNAQWNVAVTNGNVQLQTAETPHFALYTQTPVVGGPPWAISSFNAPTHRQTSAFLPRAEISFHLSNTSQVSHAGSVTPGGVGGGRQETATSSATIPVRLQVEIQHQTPPSPEPAPQGSSAISYGSESEDFYFPEGQSTFDDRQGGAFIDWLRDTTLTIDGQDIPLCDAIQQDLVRGNIDGYASGTGNFSDNMVLSRNRVDQALDLMCSQTGLTDSELRRRFSDNIRYHGYQDAPRGDEVEAWRRVSIFFRYVVSQTDE